MRAALPLLLIVAAAPLAGCGGAHDSANLNEEQAAAAQQRAPDPEKVMAERWAQIFANPKAAVAAANDFQYKVPGYLPAGKDFEAKGAATYPEAPKAIAIDSSFIATGAAADKLDTVVFTFDVRHKGKVDRESAETYRVPVRVVLGFLGRFNVGPGDTILGALRRRESASAELHGVPVKVDAQPIAGGDAKDRHITVTFTRIGASAPANQTQGK
jgi:hypothetical protein